MHQLEIQFFFPLTEQIKLDLDYTPCDEYTAKKRAETIAGSVLIAGGTGITTSNVQLTSSFQFRPEPDCVGCWEVSPSIQVWRKRKPNLLHRKYTEFMLGWKWKDK